MEFMPGFFNIISPFTKGLLEDRQPMSTRQQRRAEITHNSLHSSLPATRATIGNSSIPSGQWNVQMEQNEVSLLNDIFLLNIEVWLVRTYPQHLLAVRKEIGG